MFTSNRKNEDKFWFFLSLVCPVWEKKVTSKKRQKKQKRKEKGEESSNNVVISGGFTFYHTQEFEKIETFLSVQ